MKQNDGAAHNLRYNEAGIIHLRQQTHLHIQTARRLLNKEHSRGALLKLFSGTYISTLSWPREPENADGLLRLRTAFAQQRIECIAMGQANPKRILAGSAAALAHGLPLLKVPGVLPFASPTARRQQKRRTRGGTVFSLVYAPINSADCTVIDGARTTNLARTVVDQAAAVPSDSFFHFAEALALADAALRGSAETLGTQGKETADSLMWPGAAPRFLPSEWDFRIQHPRLVAPRRPASSSADWFPYLHDARGRIRGRRTLEVLLAASPLSDSVLESAAKALLIVLQLSFVQQARIVDENGQMVARVDFLLPSLGIVIECDGRTKYEVPVSLGCTSKEQF